MTPKRSHSHIKQHNLRLILNTFIEHDLLARTQICKLTHISMPTVSSLIEELIKKGIVNEVGMGASKLGRKPRLLEFNRSRKSFLAIDIGRADYTIAVSDLKGSIIKCITENFDMHQTFKARMETVKRGLSNLMKDLNFTMTSFLKIICSTPTVFVEKNQELKLIPINENYNDYNIQDFLINQLNTDVIVKHSTKLSLYGEKICGDAKHYSNAVYIDFAYGLGCALMINNYIYFDPKNVAGEFGYFYSSIEEFNNFTIAPYDFGALEKRISGKAIQEKGIAAAKKNTHSKLLEITNDDYENIDAKVIFEAAKSNDPVAYCILRDSFKYFNMALCNIINLVAPDIVILGGGFSKTGEFLLKFIVDEIQDKVLVMPKITTSTLKENAPIIGGIHYLINHTDFLSEN